MAWTLFVVSVVSRDYGALYTLGGTSAEQRTSSCALVLPMVTPLRALMMARAAACQGEPGRSNLRPARSPWPFWGVVRWFEVLARACERFY